MIDLDSTRPEALDLGRTTCSRLRTARRTQVTPPYATIDLEILPITRHGYDPTRAPDQSEPRVSPGNASNTRRGLRAQPHGDTPELDCSAD